MNNEFEFDFSTQEVALPPPSVLVQNRGLSPVMRKRRKKKLAVEEFFSANLGIRFPTMELHQKFGTAVRTRISDVNRDPEAILTIHNKHWFDEIAQVEMSEYWAELRK